MSRAVTRTPRDPRKVAEAALLAAVKQLLEAHGFRVFRRSVGAMGGTHRGKPWFFRFGTPGMADLWGYFRAPGTALNHPVRGRHIEVEIKRPGETPSAVQRDWLGLCEAEGCLVMWCDSVDMAEAKLKAWEL